MLGQARKEKAPLSAGQVLRRLAEIEEEGVQFYRALYDGTESGWVRELAESLLQAERRHGKRFLEYAKKAEHEAGSGGNTLVGTLPTQVFRKLYSPVFASRMRFKASAKYAGDIEILRLAVRIEETTALLLTELRGFVPKSQRAYISRVIKEEWGHKERLEHVLKKRLADR